MKIEKSEVKGIIIVMMNSTTDAAWQWYHTQYYVM